MHKEEHDTPVAITDTISNTVSEYGLLVDAYSLGCTLRYMLTGCLPHINPRTAIAEQQGLFHNLFSKCLPSSKKKNKKRQKRYRLVEDLPIEAQQLMSAMTEKAERNRTSVRNARRNPWIAKVLPELKQKKVQYLKLAIDEKVEEEEDIKEQTVQEEVVLKKEEEEEENPVTF